MRVGVYVALPIFRRAIALIIINTCDTTIYTCDNTVLTCDMG